MELYQLEYFRTVCRCRSYTKAAKLLFISQPAVSAVIKKLETECGGILIERKANQFELTPMGNALLTSAEKIHVEVEILKDELASLVDKQNDAIKIGVPSLICPHLVSRIFTEFLPQNPDVNVKIQQMMQRDAKNALLDSNIDIAVMMSDDTLPTFLRIQPLQPLELRFYCNRENPLHEKPLATPKDIEKQTMMLSQTEYGYGKRTMDYFDRCRIAPKVLRIGSLQSYEVKELLERGVGCMILPKGSFGEPGIALDHFFQMELMMVWNWRRKLSPGHNRLMNFILEATGSDAVPE